MVLLPVELLGFPPLERRLAVLLAVIQRSLVARLDRVQEMDVLDPGWERQQAIPLATPLVAPQTRLEPGQNLVEALIWLEQGWERWALLAERVSNGESKRM